ncbi:hypothetical protein B1R94_18015 [Mycolicibacterium litorale]|nr:hypothetical protein B1R94_18015 [Mycolicibacterium litorale]
MRPQNVPTDPTVEVMLRRIGRSVLEDVWIGRRAALCMLIGVVVLGVDASTGWLAADHSVWISRVAIGLFTVTGALSSIALWRRRFRWCCAAAYAGGLSTVVGFAVVWWHQTAPQSLTPGPSAWMTVGVVCAAALTIGWLRLILTPLERSQPDIRRGSVQEAV